MKIYNDKGAPVNRLYQQQAEEKQKEKVRAEEKNQGDKLAISAEAAKVREAVEAVRELDEVRAQKVEELKAALDAGTYVTDSRRIAEAMLKKQDS